MLRRSALVSPLLLLSCAAGLTDEEKPAQVPPAAPREFRAAWVASVANIDWPSRPDLTVSQQQAEIVLMLDRAQALNLNAIVLQVRPAADALYPSDLEPWSEYLMGAQGRAPEPFYDPLKMWIEEAHLRGIELHAWLNPYRARHTSAKSALANNHIAVTHPWAVKQYGDVLWMDPAEPAAMKRTLDVVADLVHRYDLDGIHLDDYFYPYPVSAVDGTALDFPDQPAWQRYLSGRGQAGRADWRREQVNHLIEQMYSVIHREKSWVRFGISPFGLGRPERRSPGISGFSQYDKIYADAELWLSQGWLDYVAPQLYWPIDQAPQAFPVLLETWAQENTQSRHLWPGLFTSRIDNSSKSWRPDEIARQIGLARDHTGVSGHIHFSMSALLQDRQGIATLLRNGLYASAALVPATPWLGTHTPATPRLFLRRSVSPNCPGRVRIETTDDPLVNRFSIWSHYGSKWVFAVQGVRQIELTLHNDPELGYPDTIVVSSVSRLGMESARTTLHLPPQSARASLTC